MVAKRSSAYSTNYLVDLDNAIVVDVEATTAIRQAEVTAAKRMIERIYYSGRLLNMTIRSDRKSADDTPWAVDARHAMQATTGDQLKVRYEVPRELPPELNALRFRMDERGENKQ